VVAVVRVAVVRVAVAVVRVAVAVVRVAVAVVSVTVVRVAVVQGGRGRGVSVDGWRGWVAAVDSG
jgi:hypothetical protein